MSRAISYNLLPQEDKDDRPVTDRPTPGTRKAYLHAAFSLAACALWIVCSSTIILTNRIIMRELAFAFPLAVAGMGMGISSIACVIYVDVLRMVPNTGPPVHLRFYLFKIVPVGLSAALAIASGNKTYLFLSVSFIEMARAFMPVLTMLALWLAGLESPTRDAIKAVVLTAAGCALAAYGEVHLTAFGAICMGVNLLLELVRVVMTQFLLSGMGMHPLQTLKLLAPPATVGLVVASYFQEWPAMVKSGLVAVPGKHPWCFLLAGSLGMMVNVLAINIIKLSSATTLKVLAAVRGPLVVMCGVVLFAEKVTLVELLGYSVALVGFVWYNYAKQGQHVQEALQAKQQEKESE